METRQQIRQFILKNFLFSSDEAALADDVSMIETGVIDSTGVLELIAFLEEQFKLKVDDEEMTPENLDSVNKVVAFVTSKL